MRYEIRTDKPSTGTNLFFFPSAEQKDSEMHLGISVLFLLCTQKERRRRKKKKHTPGTKRSAHFALSLNDCIISFPGKPLGFIKGDEKQMRTILICMENSFSGAACTGAPR